MKYFPIFQDMARTLEPFTNEEKGELLTAMMAYAFNGEIIEITGNGRYVWPMVQHVIDQSRETYERMVQNGKSGAQKRWRDHRDPIENHKETIETDSMNNNNNNNSNNNNNNNSNTNMGTAPRFVPPTRGEVVDYAVSRGGTEAQGEQIHDYYDSQGWRVGKNPMRDWRAAVRGWLSRDKQRKAEREERFAPGKAPVKSVPEQQYTQRDYGSGNIIPDDWLEAAQ